VRRHMLQPCQNWLLRGAWALPWILSQVFVAIVGFETAGGTAKSARSYLQARFGIRIRCGANHIMPKNYLSVAGLVLALHTIASFLRHKDLSPMRLTLYARMLPVG
jgi:hypothetical protein